MGTQVQQIGQDAVILLQGERSIEVANESVIVNAGGVLPNDFLRKVGIEIETKYGTA